MKLVGSVLGPIRTNCYLMIQTEKKEALIIDPGTEQLPWRQKLTEGCDTEGHPSDPRPSGSYQAMPGLGNIMVFRFMWVRRTRNAYRGCG